ncbi:MiaB family protein, possibly involved in tRNA or rRNA modification [Rubellimicrobium mesophilum DSM 19309]|uniref:MiaB family protein, possibly involved in tRNA or rRNA modification n=1 Tax=Rubellimicrobium mesophilum DSM 19309 TaxID=442562 RepID=A0A017HMY3_9RHOB|nr:MiaB family protein, possibly involved in tRNA or rRNA modification [Rubellimicrobium mesophilum DSM 19309]
MNAPVFATLGCRLNAWETEAMKTLAAQAGVTDAVVVNTCAVTQEAVRKAKQEIRRLARENPGARVVVTGCAAQVEPETFAAMPEVSLVLGNAEKMAAESWAQVGRSEAPDFVGRTERVQVDDIMSVRETASHLIDGFGTRARAYVQVQNGCDHRCTFCIIPYGLGELALRPGGRRGGPDRAPRGQGIPRGRADRRGPHLLGRGPAWHPAPRGPRDAGPEARPRPRAPSHLFHRLHRGRPAPHGGAGHRAAPDAAPAPEPPGRPRPDLEAHEAPPPARRRPPLLRGGPAAPPRRDLRRRPHRGLPDRDRGDVRRHPAAGG